MVSEEEELPEKEAFLTMVVGNDVGTVAENTEKETSENHRLEEPTGTCSNVKPPSTNPNRARLLELRKIVWIAEGAYLGVLLRVTLTSISKRSSPLAQLGAGWFLPNMAGCFVMGCVVSLHDWLTDLPYIYQAIATGFCGSCTTFATWKGTVIKGYARGLWVQGLVQSLATYATSQIGFVAGRHLADLLRLLKPRFSTLVQTSRSAISSTGSQEICHLKAMSVSVNDGSPSSYSVAVHSSERSRSFLAQRTVLITAASVCLYLCTTTAVWLGAFWDTSEERRFWWIAVAMGPFGAMARYLLALWNPRFPNFPLLTFAANFGATVGNIFLYILEAHLAGHVDEYLFKFWVLKGVSTGTFGSLSTASSWINELNKLGARNVFYGYRYGLVTVLVTDAVGLVIIGLWVLSGKSVNLLAAPIVACDELLPLINSTLTAGL